MAVVDYITPFKRRKRGLCSSYLASSCPLHPDLDNAVGLGSSQPGDSSHQGEATATATVVHKPQPQVGQQQPQQEGGPHIRSNGTGCALPLPHQAQAQRAEEVAVWIEKGSLQMPPVAVPLILIGPGTGA